MKKKFKKIITFGSLIGLPMFASVAASCNAATNKGALTQAEKFKNLLQTELNDKASITESEFRKLVLTSEADPKKVIYDLIGKEALDPDVIDFIDNADKIEVIKNKDEMTITFKVIVKGENPFTVTVNFDKCTFMPEQLQDMLDKFKNTVATTKTEAEVKALEFKNTSFIKAVPQISGLTTEELELPKDESEMSDGPKITINKDKGSLEFTFTFDFSDVEGFGENPIFHKTLIVNEFSVPKRELIVRPLILALEDDESTWEEITYGDQKDDANNFDGIWQGVLDNLKNSENKIYFRVVRKATPSKTEYYEFTPAEKDRDGNDRKDKDGHLLNDGHLIDYDNLIIRVESILDNQDISEILINKAWGPNADQQTIAISKESVDVNYDSPDLDYSKPDFEEATLHVTFIGNFHSEDEQAQP